MYSKAVLIFIFIVSGSLYSQVVFSRHSVDNTFEDAKKYRVVDLDEDGDLDIVAAANDLTVPVVNIAWFENDGNMSFSRITISGSFNGARSVGVGDLDGDNDIDVVGGSADIDPVTWWENDGTPGDPFWTAHELTGSNDSTYSVDVIDLDSDNDDDILATFLHGDSSGWYENDGSGNFNFNRTANNYGGAVDLIAADVDSDGYLDLLGAAFYSGIISWWNQTSQGVFSAKTDISTSFFTPNSIFAGDLNGDGNKDVVSAGHYNEEGVSWWENNGSGFSSSENEIDTDFQWGRNAVMSDINMDGNMDVVACADIDNEIAWYENDGNENFSKNSITTSFTYAYYVQSLDFDGDGDFDIIGSARDDDEIAWWENRSEDRQYTASGDVSAVLFLSGKVEIDFSAGTADTTSVFYNLHENKDRTSLGTGIDHIAINGFYTIKTEKTSYTGVIIFDYSNVSEWSSITDTADLVICVWDTVSDNWIVAGSSQTHADNSKITVNGINAEMIPFSKWVLGSSTADNPLPVTLLSLAGDYNKQKITLEWKTASEIENIGFEIERRLGSSEDAELIASYISIPGLKGQGSSAAKMFYTWEDNDILTDTSYIYYLYNLDYSGKRNFLKSVEISTKSVDIPGGFEIVGNYPNPFNGSTNILFETRKVSLNEVEQNFYSLIIYDMLGRKIKTLFNGSLEPGIHSVHWNGTNGQSQSVSTGRYIFVLSNSLKYLSGHLLFVK